MIASDVHRIYARGIYQSVEASIDSDSDKEVLRYKLTENRRFTGIRFEGNTLFADSVLRRSLEINRTQPLNYNRMQRGLNEIRSLYREAGYALMRYTKTDNISPGQRIKLNP